jgi:hypothetical protein
LAVGGEFAHQLVALAAVICDSAAVSVAFAGVPAVSGVRWLAT